VGWYELSVAPLGAILAILWQYNPLTILLGGLPLLVVRHSYGVAIRLQHQTHDALRALVQVIDERDHHTLDHSERVSQYAQSIAEALGLSQEEIEVIAPAALLHDLGKVGMADDVLFSTSSLNPAERAHAQKHAEVGAMLLSKFPLFGKGTLLVRYHHERFDGKGYPEGLKGEDIPLGARIISVADAFQAMTEERTYRRALSQEDAIAQLTHGSGTQFDPRVVEAFIRVLHTTH
jgi:putative nucleotidyltransferase with HDIG domain